MKTGIFATLVMLMFGQAPVDQPAETPAMARVVTGESRMTQCISPVHVTRVDGEERQLPPFGFELEPGIHTLHGTAKLNLAYCRVQSDMREARVPPLEAMFEAGKTYHVGFDHSSPDRAEWRIVIWKVEDRED